MCVFTQFCDLGWIWTDLTLPIAIEISCCLSIVFGFLRFRRECVLNINSYMRKGSVRTQTDACACLTDAYECIHTDAYGRILGTRYAGTFVHIVDLVHIVHISHAVDTVQYIL